MNTSAQTNIAMALDTIESMRDAVMALDRSGKIIMLNPAAESLLGVRADDTVGQIFAEHFVSREDLEALNDCILQAVYEPSIPHVTEICIRKEGQETRHLVVRTNLLKSQEGNPQGVIAVIADISERVRLLEERVEQKTTQNQFGQFFIYILCIYSIGTIINHLAGIYPESLNLETTAFSWIYLLIMLVPSLVAIRIMHIPLSTLGMTLKNWKKSLSEGIAASVGLIAIGSLIVMILRHNSCLPYKPLPLVWSGVLPYYAHSFVQELLARGLMQSSFERFFEGHSGLKAVLLTSVFGGLVHIHFGLVAVLITFVVGLFFGAFYLRHHNLIGLTLLHGTLGIFAFTSGLL